MKILTIIALTLSLIGCESGGSDEPQNDAATVDITPLLNGATAEAEHSYWNCNVDFNGSASTGVFQIFANGTGGSSIAGAFAWEPVVDAVEITNDGELSIIYDVRVNRDMTYTTFSEFYGVGATAYYQCGLVRF